MSGEQITAKEIISTTEAQSLKKEPISKRVNINELLSKVRQEKNKEKKGNYIFLALVFGVVAVTGIIASL